MKDLLADIGIVIAAVLIVVIFAVIVFSGMSGCANPVETEEPGVSVGGLWQNYYSMINSNGGRALTADRKTRTAGMRCFAMHTGTAYDCSDTTCLLVYGTSKPGYSRIDATNCHVISGDYAGMNKECQILSQGGAVRAIMRYVEDQPNIEYYLPGYENSGNPYLRCDVPGHTLWLR